MINDRNLKKLDKLINEASDIAIVAHVDPDGDSIGSIMALREIMLEKAKNVDFYINGDIPFNYKFIKDVNKGSTIEEKKQYDLFFVLDSSDLSRIGDKSTLFHNSKVTVCIDHHKTNKGFCDLNIIEPDFSSTGEIIFEIFKKLNYKINENAAENIFISIITDTGKFIYDNANYKTFENVSELLKKGIDKNLIVKNLYSSEPKDVFRLKTDIFASTDFYFKDKVAISNLSIKSLKRYKLSLKDIDGLVERIRDIKNVEVSILIKEISKDKFKVSMRSIGNVDVSSIASFFGGGGHKNAAGFNSENIEYQKLKETLLKEVSNEL